MKNLLLIIFFLTLPLSSYAQGDTILFSDAIKIKFKKYKKDTALAYRKGDIERGKFLFDSLVQHRLAGTKFDDFQLKKTGGGTLKLGKIEKPVILITYASWCVTSKCEIHAINRLAKQYGKSVKFVVLYWDRKHNMKKNSRKFNRHITVCYAHESYKNDAPVVAALKHTLGLPTSYYIDEQMRLVTIRRCGLQQYAKKVPSNNDVAVNYNSYIDGLSTILLDQKLEKVAVASAK